MKIGVTPEFGSLLPFAAASPFKGSLMSLTGVGDAAKRDSPAKGASMPLSTPVERPTDSRCLSTATSKTSSFGMCWWSTDFVADVSTKRQLVRKLD